MAMTCFQTNFSNDLHSKKIKVNGVLEYLRYEIPDISEDILFDLRVIYNELITNAIIHGNKQDDTKKVELFIMIDDTDITAIIKDEGTGFDASDLSRQAKTQDNFFCEHGRGLQLVLGLADFVKWNETGNEVMLYKHLQVDT